MASNITIANWALSKIGADTITAFTEDSKEGRAVNLLYEIIRDTVLRDNAWNFATRRRALARSTSSPEWGYSYKYQLPSDCLRVISIDGVDASYKVEGRFLVTDEEAINLLYIARITDPNEYTASFMDAFATRLAAELSYLITQSNSAAEQLTAQYDRKLAEAKVLDSKEDTPDDYYRDNSWINVRGGGLL